MANPNIPCPAPAPIDPDLMIFRSCLDGEPKVISATDPCEALDGDVSIERLVEARYLLGLEIEARLAAQGRPVTAS
jgi:hypothetical protein